MRLLGSVSGVVAAVFAVVALTVVPPDAVQGESQRLMYVHVPAAWVAYLSFLVVLVSSVGHLRGRDLRWDHRARAAAELGVGLTALAIVLGSVWGRVTWGVWWTWDARLLTTVVLLLVYVGYLGIRGLSDDPHLNARRAAVVGVMAFVNVPLVHFSVVWWRTLHQPPTVLAPQASAPIATSMALTLVLGILCFSLLATWVFLRRTAVLARACAVRRASTMNPAPVEPAPVGPIVVVRAPSAEEGP